MLQLKDIPSVALAVVLAAVVIGIGATVTSDMGSSLDATKNNTVGGASATGALNNGTAGLENLAKKMPLVGTIVALAIVLGVVFAALAFRR